MNYDGLRIKDDRLVARGIRLHPDLWAHLDTQARRDRRTTSDFLRLHIERAFGFDQDVQGMHESSAER